MRYTNQELIAMKHVPTYMFVPDKTNVYIPVKVVAGSSIEYTCKTTSNETKIINKKKLNIKNQSCHAISELVALCQAPNNLIDGDMNEAMLMHTIHTRFQHERWYSWMGPILLCVNPFQWTTGRYFFVFFNATVSY